MIDIHAHILPGIDDGAEDIYDTIEMAAMAADIGVTGIIATPHCNLPGIFDNYFDNEYVEIFKAASHAIKREGIPLKLYPGMEVFGTYDVPDLLVQGKIMPLNQSRYILLEFAFDEDPDFATDLLARVKDVGAKPIVAHAERYEFMKDNPKIAYQWIKSGYTIQANRGSFLGRFGRRARETAYRLLNHNLIAVVASDAHSPYARTPYLLDIYEELREEYSESYAEVLFSENPERICGNKSVIKMGAIPFSDYEL